MILKIYYKICSKILQILMQPSMYPSFFISAADLQIWPCAAVPVFTEVASESFRATKRTMYSVVMIEVENGVLFVRLSKVFLIIQLGFQKAKE